ncbi:MAG: hypothetical protein MZW92_14130 [Comamonadaceae bacterium]|nr:hypothetical protein [Comamonadaceae bacterium]
MRRLSATAAALARRLHRPLAVCRGDRRAVGAAARAFVTARPPAGELLWPLVVGRRRDDAVSTPNAQRLRDCLARLNAGARRAGQQQPARPGAGGPPRRGADDARRPDARRRRGLHA